MSCMWQRCGYPHLHWDSNTDHSMWSTVQKLMQFQAARRSEQVIVPLKHMHSSLHQDLEFRNSILADSNTGEFSLWKNIFIETRDSTAWWACNSGCHRCQLVLKGLRCDSQQDRAEAICKTRGEGCDSDFSENFFSPAVWELSRGYWGLMCSLESTMAQMEAEQASVTDVSGELWLKWQVARTGLLGLFILQFWLQTKPLGQRRGTRRVSCSGSLRNHNCHCATLDTLISLYPRLQPSDFSFALFLVPTPIF